MLLGLVGARASSLAHQDVCHRMRNRLKSLRAERGWSQVELGDRLGVSRQTIISIENGKYDPSLPLAFKIARLFGEPIEAIFDDGQS